MMSDLKNYRVGDTIFAASVQVKCEAIQFSWPVDYVGYPLTGYASWILPRPKDFAVLVGWRSLVRQRRNNGTASTEPTEFIKHLMRSTGSLSWGALETKLGLRSDQLRQYFISRENHRSRSDRHLKDPVRWMTTSSLKILIVAASLQHRTRRGTSTYPTVYIDRRPNCQPLRPTETGSMLRVLDQDELYARLGLAWRSHVRDRRRLDSSPSYEDMPWLVKKSVSIANELWSRHTGFEKRCIALAVRRKGGRALLQLFIS